MRCQHPCCDRRTQIRLIRNITILLENALSQCEYKPRNAWGLGSAVGTLGRYLSGARLICCWWQLCIFA